jgi:hypothetical protein
LRIEINNLSHIKHQIRITSGREDLLGYQPKHVFNQNDVQNRKDHAFALRPTNLFQITIHLGKLLQAFEWIRVEHMPVRMKDSLLFSYHYGHSTRIRCVIGEA